jgi:hypothetical protein
VLTLIVGYSYARAQDKFTVLVIAQLVTWPPLLFSSAPFFYSSRYAGDLLYVFYLEYVALVFFGVSFLGLVLGSVAHFLYEEFGGGSAEPISIHLQTLSTEALLEEQEDLRSRMHNMGTYDSRDRVVFFAIEAELERRGLTSKPKPESPT